MMEIMFMLAILSIGLFMFLDKHLWGMIAGLTFFFIGIYFSRPRFNKHRD